MAYSKKDVTGMKGARKKGTMANMAGAMKKKPGASTRPKPGGPVKPKPVKRGR